MVNEMEQNIIDSYFEDSVELEDECIYDADADVLNVQTKDNDKPNYLDDEFVNSEHFINTGSIEEFGIERVSKVTGKKVTNYVDNDTFCNAVIDWKFKCETAEQEGKPKPKMPDIIGEYIIRIADGLSRRWNFRNYTYLDEMREDAIYMAIRAVKNYDPLKSNNNNAFGYFNRVIWTAMVTRIKIEKDEHEIKLNLLKDPMYLGYESQDGIGDDHIDKNRMISVYDQRD